MPVSWAGREVSDAAGSRSQDGITTNPTLLLFRCRSLSQLALVTRAKYILPSGSVRNFAESEDFVRRTHIVRLPLGARLTYLFTVYLLRAKQERWSKLSRNSFSESELKENELFDKIITNEMFVRVYLYFITTITWKCTGYGINWTCLFAFPCEMCFPGLVWCSCCVTLQSYFTVKREFLCKALWLKQVIFGAVVSLSVRWRCILCLSIL